MLTFSGAFGFSSNGIVLDEMGKLSEGVIRAGGKAGNYGFPGHVYGYSLYVLFF